MSTTYNLTCDQGATLQFTVNYLQATPSVTWSAATDFDTNDVGAPLAAPNGFVYNCTVPGQSGSTEPAWPTTIGNTIEDGTVVWTCAGPNVQAVDLTSYTAYMSVATGTNPTSYLATISTTPSSNGDIVLGANGSITATVTGETTLTFTTTPLFFDLFIVGPTDVTTMVVTGKIKINNNVTTPVYV